MISVSVDLFGSRSSLPLSQASESLLLHALPLSRPPFMLLTNDVNLYYTHTGRNDRLHYTTVYSPYTSQRVPIPTNLSDWGCT